MSKRPTRENESTRKRPAARKPRRPPKQRRLQVKSQLVADSVELLEAAMQLIDVPSHWSRKAYALTGRGRSVRVDDEAAVRFCLAGSVLRAEHLIHGTEIPISTSPDPEPDDLFEPVLPPDCPPRLTVAMVALAIAAGRELNRLGVAFMSDEGFESGERLASKLPLPLLLGMHPRARLGTCHEALSFARHYLNWLRMDDGRLDEMIPDAVVQRKQR